MFCLFGHYVLYNRQHFTWHWKWHNMLTELVNQYLLWLNFKYRYELISVKVGKWVVRYFSSKSNGNTPPFPKALSFLSLYSKQL